MNLRQKLHQKLNPGQRYIAMEAGSHVGTNQTRLRTVENAYNLMEVVNRCVNLIVDLGADVEYDVKEKLQFSPVASAVRAKSLNTLLNSRPNPYMDINTFRRLLFIDLLLEGNVFVHYDGVHMYHVPAKDMEILTNEKTFVSGYLYSSTTEFTADEIIHIRDNSASSEYREYRGRSRINSALRTILTHETALDFQSKFYDNGTMIGLIIETESVLSSKLKDRKEVEWTQKFNPKSSQGRPMILDSGMKARSVNTNSFRDIDFNDSMEVMEKRICKALGVPHILLDSGNNANLRPNMELLFSTTVLPMTRKFEAQFEYFFGYDIGLSVHNVMALRPDLKAESDRYSSLVNNGIMTGNEARRALRMEQLDEEIMDKIRIPANIAGSATGVTGQEGGKPPSNDEDN